GREGLRRDPARDPRAQRRGDAEESARRAARAESRGAAARDEGGGREVGPEADDRVRLHAGADSPTDPTRISQDARVVARAKRHARDVQSRGSRRPGERLSPVAAGRTALTRYSFEPISRVDRLRPPL